MSDEWDALAEKLTNEKPPVREYRNPTPESIIAELRGWWSGIQNGTVKFLHGLPLLAEYLPAYIPGHLIAVSGYTSAGKSQLLAQLTAWVAGIQEADLLIFSLEDSRMERMISLASVVTEKIHRKRMLLGNMQGVEEEANRALETIIHWPMKIYDDVYHLRDMEALIKKHVPRIVILDYIQNIAGQGNIYERMSSAAINLFRITQENKLTMFVASQIDNESARSEAEGFIAMKGGGELAAAAHTVLHLKKGREEKNRRQVKIHVKKNKAFGNCGDIDCEFNDHWTVIEAVKVDQWTL